jgi:hypothetical protein
MLVVAPSRNWVRQVRRFVQPPGVTRCELCGATMDDEHPHLVDIAERRLLCACERCCGAIATDGPYRRLPTAIRRLSEIRLSEAEWESLQIPIGLAFIFHSSPQNRPVALYPGPAGATESLLGLESWHELARRHPVLTTLMPDVEALLIDRTEGRRDCYQVPIDRCYALVGLMRRHWRGLSGGSEAWEAISRFFARLRQSAASGGSWAHD